MVKSKLNISMEERAEIEGKASASRSRDPVLKKRKRSKLEAAKAEKKAKRGHVPKPDEVAGVMMVGAGSSEEEQAEAGKIRNNDKKREHEEANAVSSGKRRKKLLRRRMSQAEVGKVRNNETKKKKRNKPEEVNAGKKKKRTKVVKWRVSQELVDYVRTREVMGFLAMELPRPLRPNIAPDLFDQQLREEIAAEFEENREFDAYLLYQYRSKGFAEIQEEVTDDEEEKEDRPDGLQQVRRVLNEWFLEGIRGA